MEEELFILKRVEELLHDAANSSHKCEAEKGFVLASFSTAMILILRLEEMNTPDSEDFNAYRAEKLSLIKQHAACVIGLEIPRGHPISMHEVWMLQAIESARTTYES